MTNNRHHHSSAGIALPHLSDAAAVQSQDFIYYCLEVFEARYGDQIHRYYQDRSRENLWWEPQDPSDWDDLQF